MAERGPLAGSLVGTLPPSNSALSDSELEIVESTSTDESSDSSLSPSSNSESGSSSDEESGYHSRRKLYSSSRRRILWTTLEHHGVYFPPEYRPHRALPREARLLYDGAPVDLPLEAEEIAYAYARVLGRGIARQPHFIANFFSDLNAALERCGRARLTAFRECDFAPMRAYHDAQEQQRLRSLRGPKHLRPTEHHRWCWVDGEQCEVRDFALDPPGLYTGKENEHVGRFVRRVQPDEITINIGAAFANEIRAPHGHWRAVISDRTQLWLAQYTHPVAGLRRARITQAHHWVGTHLQHETARELGAYLWRVRADYRKDLRSSVSAKRDVATLLWFVDLLGLRLRSTRIHARFDHELGLASLRCANITLSEPRIMELHMQGPHNLLYKKRAAVSPVVFANLRRLLDGKNPEDTVFSKSAVRAAAEHLEQYRRMLTPVCFRAFSYSRALQLAISEYENTVIYKHIPRTPADRADVFKLLVRKVASIMCMVPQVSAENDHNNPRIKLYQWAVFRLKLKLQVLNPAFVCDEHMSVDEYRQLGLQYAREIEPRALQNYELEISQEVASGVVQLTANVTIPNDPAYVWDLIYDKMLLIDLERLHMLDRSLDVDVMQDTFIDPRIVVAFAKRHGIPLRRLMRGLARSKWALNTAPDFCY